MKVGLDMLVGLVVRVLASRSGELSSNFTSVHILRTEFERFSACSSRRNYFTKYNLPFIEEAIGHVINEEKRTNYH